ncbi:MAG: acylphosphatase [Chloroflexi bacterium]|nr:acylphosphatase [Chloroflexota bacterium]
MAEPASEVKRARLQAIVHGHVQGVNFRHYTRERARSLGLGGYVRNRWDGTVEVVAEGPEPALQALLSWLHRGPPLAQVTEVEARREPIPPGQREFHSFEVRY